MRRKRLLISIDLEETVIDILRDLKENEDTQILEFRDMIEMSMSFTYSPIPPMIPSVSPTANAKPIAVETAAPLAIEIPTPAPDCLTGTDRGAYLLDTLSAITDQTLLLDPLSPQGQAYAWMTTIDTAVDVCSYSTLNQRYAMSTFYFSTGGDAWTASSGWLTDVGECSWELVICNDDGVLTGLTMSKSNCHELTIY